MNNAKKRLLKLSFSLMIAGAALTGLLPGSAVPALAVDCPESYQFGQGTCYRTSVVCDEWGNCCCEYTYSVNPEIACLTWC